MRILERSMYLSSQFAHMFGVDEADVLTAIRTGELSGHRAGAMIFIADKAQAANWLLEHRKRNQKT